jgi:hypothetical protein
MRQCQIVGALRRDEKRTSQKRSLLCGNVGMIVITDSAHANNSVRTTKIMDMSIPKRRRRSGMTLPEG